jgi:hypothetical protein
MLVKEVQGSFVGCIGFGSLGGVDSNADHSASYPDGSHFDCHSRIDFLSTSNLCSRKTAALIQVTGKVFPAPAM